MEYNADIRAALQRHMTMGTWTIVDKGDQMEISGLLSATGVFVSLRGSRESVLATMEGLIRALVTTERLPSG